MRIPPPEHRLLSCTWLLTEGPSALTLAALSVALSAPPLARSSEKPSDLPSVLRSAW